MNAVSELFQTHRAAEIELARETLSAFMIGEAARTAEEAGFSWVAVPDAPNDHDGLRAAYDVSIRLKVPLPVSSEHCVSVVYTTAAANIAFRFVHDVHHMRLGLSFDVLDELELAHWHLGRLEEAGFAPTSLPWRLLYADLFGQAHLIPLAGAFPVDQWRFVSRCLDGGFERGLIDEARHLRADHAST